MRRPGYSVLMFASRMTRLYSSTCWRHVGAELRSHVHRLKQPLLASFGFISGACMRAVNQPASCETVSAGVFAGATMP